MLGNNTDLLIKVIGGEAEEFVVAAVPWVFLGIGTDISGHNGKRVVVSEKYI